MHSIIHSHFCILYIHHDMTRKLPLSVWKLYEQLFIISCAHIVLCVVLYVECVFLMRAICGCGLCFLFFTFSILISEVQH